MSLSTATARLVTTAARLRHLVDVEGQEAARAWFDELENEPAGLQCAAEPAASIDLALQTCQEGPLLESIRLTLEALLLEPHARD